MNKPFHVRELNNGVVVEFFDQGNRYFGDYHRVKINAVVTIPFDLASLPDDLQKFAATYSDCVKLNKTLEQMGVATSKVEAVTESLIDNFIKTVGGYLEKENFAVCLLRKSMTEKRKMSYFSL